MNTIHTLNELRSIVKAQRAANRRIGFVPTMGNLHEGHIRLVEVARETCDFIISSIFVNPLQFGAHEDLDAYPRTLPQDSEKLAAAKCNLLFAPSVSEMYPEGMDKQTRVIVPDVSELHCGTSRPGHFEGVATVVTMLFNMVQPDRAFFGEKDYQQLAVIRKMARDLRLPIDIIGVPTVRETDGLAKSSRNGYLSESQRQTAVTVFKALQHAAQAIKDNKLTLDSITEQAQKTLAEAGFKNDYFNIVNSQTLKPATENDKEVTLLVAAYLGSTRLIDNISLTRE
ncbi:MAG: pantoate--beta-alanine ligase [Hahellaceae bacterium]|nr:pantoate--beta-alanine ligase [Hahellaceae bacterium]MCP5168492.1 pantoate--beta-alanine ligase [Hahellaceae bacterium]